MSFQKRPTQKMGLSLQMTQKPQLLQCNEAADVEPGCRKCYRLYPDGFFCPGGEKTLIIKRKINPRERKIIEDYLCY